LPALEQVLETYPETVKVVFKHFPLRSHKFAFKAAQATVAADKQGRFWAFHDKLFENYKAINESMIRKTAQDLGLDMAQFDEGMKNPETTALIRKDVSDGQAAGVGGTPAVFINGRRLKNRSPAGFKASIDAELKRLAGESSPSG
jgi:protein-disulfide isomerase